MALLRRRAAGRQGGIRPFKAGVIALVALGLLTFFAGGRVNPFSQPFELKGAFRSAPGVDARTPVRIAGVEVGKVVAVEPLPGKGALVTMEIEPKGLPIHSDAELELESRTILEGTFVIELRPGTPGAKELADGATIPVGQTAGAVQLGDILGALNSDVRADTQSLVRELATALRGGGAAALNENAALLAPAYRNQALAMDAALGLEPDRDVQRGLRGTRRTLAAFGRNRSALQGLVTGARAVFGAMARQDAALEQSLPALEDLLRTGEPALAAVDRSLPPLRAFAIEARPGVERLAPALDASLPFLRELRGLAGRDELQRTARALRRHVPALFAFNRESVPLLGQIRAAGRCTNRVLVPFVTKDFPDPDFPANSGTVNQKLQRAFVGLAGESRAFDANNSFFNVSVAPPTERVRPASPPDGGVSPPPRRPDVPCETQEPPNLDAPATTVVVPNSSPVPVSARAAALRRADKLADEWFAELERDRRRLLRKGARR
jgi:ABC-type transporter Mla subunit MlaD